MDLADLKKLRKLVPGSVFIFFVVPLYQYLSTNIFSIDSSLKFTIEGYGTVIAFIIGTFFSNLKVRSIRIKRDLYKIDENIKDRLIEIAMGSNFNHPNLKDIKDSKKLMDIFYRFVDNSESLKERSKLVRDNGLFWTSMADVTILSCVFSWVYCLSIWFIELDPLLVSAGLMIGCIGFLTGHFIYPIAAKNQISLSNNQIDFIATLNKDDLRVKINELFI